MKLTKFLALGLVAFSLTSCLGDDNNGGNSAATYTDFLDVDPTFHKCYTDGGESFDIENSSELTSFAKNVTDGRVLAQFQVEYDSSGKIAGGFTFLTVANCYTKSSSDSKPRIENNAVRNVTAQIYSVTNKYLNIVPEVNTGSENIKVPVKDNFCLAVDEVIGDEVYLTLYYDNGGVTDKVNTVSQAISFNLQAALNSVRSQITPREGKIKIILSNNKSIMGQIDWK